MDYRDLALAIKTGKYDYAVCDAELGASGRLDYLKACLADHDCRSSVEQHLRKVAPEVLGEAPLKFTYIASKNGIRSCERLESK